MYDISFKDINRKDIGLCNKAQLFRIHNDTNDMLVISCKKRSRNNFGPHIV